MSVPSNSRAALIGKHVDVLDKGWIELQDMMGGDLAIVNAARVSFLSESKGSERDKKLLFYLLQHRHTSPFEQVEFKFRVRAPLVVWWQWVRHRTWHVNSPVATQRSARAISTCPERGGSSRPTTSRPAKAS